MAPRLDPTDRHPRATGRTIARLRGEVAARDGDRCVLCARPIDLTLPGTHPLGPTLEHRIPLARGGTDALDNLALAHRACNSRRGDREPDELGPRSREW